MADGFVHFVQAFLVLTVISVVTAIAVFVGRWIKGE